jgi:acetyl-CoA carboxylase beta subunit
MERVFIRHITKCSECPSHKFTRNVARAFSRCLECHREIPDEDFDKFPKFCNLEITKRW